MSPHGYDESMADDRAFAYTFRAGAQWKPELTWPETHDPRGPIRSQSARDRISVIELGINQ